MIDAVWREHSGSFLQHNVWVDDIEGSGPATSKDGELTPAGRVAILTYLDKARDFEESLLELSNAQLVF